MRARYFLVWMGILTTVNMLALTDTYLTLRKVAAESEMNCDNIGKIVKILHWEMEQINQKPIDKW